MAKRNINVLWYLSGKESGCNALNTGDTGWFCASGRSSEEGNGNPLQDSCLENPMDNESVGLQSIGLQRVKHD